MAYEATIFCDRCSTIIAAASTARKARAENRRMGGMSRPPVDVCALCVQTAAGADERDASAVTTHQRHRHGDGAL